MYNNTNTEEMTLFSQKGQLLADLNEIAQGNEITKITSLKNTDEIKEVVKCFSDFNRKNIKIRLFIQAKKLLNNITTLDIISNSQHSQEERRQARISLDICTVIQMMEN